MRQPEKLRSGLALHRQRENFLISKMSAAENFIGHTVSYIDGNVTNAGNKTVTQWWWRSRSRRDGAGAQQEPGMPLQAIRTNGATWSG